MNKTLENLSKDLSLNNSTEYIRNKLEAYGVFQNLRATGQRKDSLLSKTSSSESVSPQKPPGAFLEIGDDNKVRTTQLVYYIKNGKEYQALCEPRHIFSLERGRLSLPLWPQEVDCINFRPKFVYDESTFREPFYNPSKAVNVPKLVSHEGKGHVVYTNEPAPAEYFTIARPGPNLSYQGFAQRNVDDISLSFESRFESGNLCKAVQVGKWDYELYLRYDLFTSKHTQWFFFAVRNMKQGQTYRFTIVNFYKSGSLYNMGMKPLMYSDKQAKLKGIGWRRVGFNIKYFKTDIRREEQRSSYYYALTWSCKLPFGGDTVYFAHCYPYTYSDLKVKGYHMFHTTTLNFIGSYWQTYEYLQVVTSKPDVAKFCKQRMLCHTLAGNPVPVLTISSPSATLEEAKAKKAVIFTARVHPGESNSSWMMKGLIDFLTGPHPDAKLLRDMFVFKIIPMLNPDGVIIGNYRCSLSARDLNRNYRSDLKEAFPTVWHTKSMIAKLVKERQVVIYCDLHGHSRRHNVFIYGCQGNPKGEKGKVNFWTALERIFPRMLSLNASDKFSYKSSNFRVQRSKEGTGRIVMWQQMGILNSFTLEATFCGASLEGKLQGYHFSAKDFESIGHHLCDTLLDYCDPDETNTNFVMHQILEERRAQILEKLKSQGISLPADTDPLDMEQEILWEDSESVSDDAGSDSSLSDGAPVGNFAKKSETVGQLAKKKTKTKKKKKPKGKVALNSGAKLKMAHTEDAKGSTDFTEGAGVSRPDVKQEQRKAQPSGKEPLSKSNVPKQPQSERGNSASSLHSNQSAGVSVQYKHRGHSLTAGMSGGIPIHVQERLEERMRKRSDAESHAVGLGSYVSMQMETSWGPQQMSMNSFHQEPWRYPPPRRSPLQISSLLPRQMDGVAEAGCPGVSSSNISLRPSHHEKEMLQSESAHAVANQMKELMERYNLPVNPTSNLLSLSRFFRNNHSLVGGNKHVYLDMVKTLRRPDGSGGVDNVPLNHPTRSCKDCAAEGTRETRSTYHPKSNVVPVPKERSTDFLPALPPSQSVTTTDAPTDVLTENETGGNFAPLYSDQLPHIDVNRGEAVNSKMSSYQGGVDKDDMGYDSDDEDNESEDDDSDNNVIQATSLTALTQEEAYSHTDMSEPVPKSFSVPEAGMSNLPCRLPPPPKEQAIPESFTTKLSKEEIVYEDSILSPITEMHRDGDSHMKRHINRVAAAVEALEEIKFSSNETLNSIKVKRSQAGERKELSLPATVMLSGSFLGSSNNTSTFSESSDGKVGEVDQKASARVKLSNSKIEYRGISAYERVSKHSSIERHKLPSLHNNSKLTRPSTSRPEGNIIPKSVTLDFPQRVTHTSYSRTRPQL